MRVYYELDRLYLLRIHLEPEEDRQLELESLEGPGSNPSLLSFLKNLSGTSVVWSWPRYDRDSFSQLSAQITDQHGAATL